jgi:hypothetical protein
MLQEVQGLTASAASGITEEHGSFREFMAAYEGAERRGEGEDLVAECQIRSLKNGVPTNRRVGPVSRVASSWPEPEPTQVSFFLCSLAHTPGAFAQSIRHHAW